MGHIGKNIKKIRNIKSLSQQAFADLFELTRGNISSYEEMRAEPKIETLLQIAKYFSIPLEDFIDKDLSVNELLHFKSSLVMEPEKFALAQKIVPITFVAGNYMQEYILNYDKEEYVNQLPHISVPYNTTKQKLLAIELINPDGLPSGFNFMNGDILIFEMVDIENIHRIIGKLAMVIGNNEIKSGIYKQNKEEIRIELNEFIQYPFLLESDLQYWVLKGVYKLY